jgi:hypothetical protein
MGVKGIGQSRRIYRLQDYAAVVLVIIIKAAEKDERRTDIDMIGEEAAGDAQLSHSRSDDPYKVLPISGWISPWFQESPVKTSGVVLPVGKKKKFGLPKKVNVGVRLGSARLFM